MNHKTLLILLSQLCTLQLAHAATTQQIPVNLMYSGKPIDSLCFMTKDKNEIDLNHCGAKANKLVVKGINADLSKKGYLGYDYEDKSISPGLPGYSYYQYFPASDNKYWVYTINHSGGTGQFSSVNLIERKNSNTIVIYNIAGGDRCNGGIGDVSEKNHGLTYSVNLTAFDLVRLADKNIKLKPYDDLAACAVCCTAKSFYTIHENAKPQLDHVDLEKVADISELPAQGNVEACFNKLYVSYLKANSTLLNQKQLLSFANQFRKTCIK